MRGGKEARFFVRRVVDNNASLLPTFIGIISQCYCAHLSHSTHFIQLGYQICRNNIWEDKRCTFFCQIYVGIYIYIYGELLYQFPHHQIAFSLSFFLIIKFPLLTFPLFSPKKKKKKSLNIKIK